ncbi:putative leader peptide [Rhodococcus coprophilus]
MWTETCRPDTVRCAPRGTLRLMTEAWSRRHVDLCRTRSSLCAY